MSYIFTYAGTPCEECAIARFLNDDGELPEHLEVREVKKDLSVIVRKNIEQLSEEEYMTGNDTICFFGEEVK